MRESEPTMAENVAQAATAFQRQSTGHVPRLVTVVLSEDVLVFTLLGALTAAECAMAESPAGAALVQEFHRQLFADACPSLREEIQRITGVEVREATAQVETNTGTMIQVLLLKERISAEIWNQ